jgi:predicted DNA-binding protein
MSTLSLKLPDTLLARLEAASRRRRVRKAALVRAALEKELATMECCEEYGVTPAELERAANRELAAIRKARKSGNLRAWKPNS